MTSSEREAILLELLTRYRTLFISTTIPEYLDFVEDLLTLVRRM